MIYTLINFINDSLPAINATNLNKMDAAIKTAYEKPTGMKNLIINGGFSIWQRGTAFSANVYTADRLYVTGATSGRSTNSPPETTYSIALTPTGGWSIRQPIELTRAGSNSQFKVGNKFTLSFKVYGTAGAVINLNMSFRNTVASSTDAVTDQSLSNIHTIQVSNTWEEVTVSFTVGATAHANNLSYEMTINSTDTNTIRLASIQLEHESISTPLEKRPIGVELALCKRYTKDLHGIYIRPYLYTANVIYFSIPLDTRTAIGILTVGAETTDWEIYTVAGVAQTSFVLAYSDIINGSLIITATKTAHGLTDAALRFKTVTKNIISVEL